MRDVMSTRDEGTKLTWVKPRWSKRQFELHDGDTIVATLAWGRGTRALAQWGEIHLQFSRQGWLRPRILVHTADSVEADVLIATFAQLGGRLSFPDGRALRWTKPKWLTRERIWVDTAQRELVRFHPARHTTVVVTT
jgi:hypothetical protein